MPRMKHSWHLMLLLLTACSAALAEELDDLNWWSLKPLVLPAVPDVNTPDAARARTAIDRFIIAKQREHGLTLSPEADRRTLIRRLKRGATSYKAILEDVRRTLAVDFLLHSEMSVASIAYRLAYHDPSNFGRAFRSWFGISPGQYRARARTQRK